MAEGPGYDVAYRRRRERRTDYKKRLALLKSGEHRAAIRLSNKHARVQIIAYDPDGDRTVASAYSDQLGDYGWDQYTGNMAAAYLTGFLAGHRAQDAGINMIVVDFGPLNEQERTRAYATVRGLQDSGIEFEVGQDRLPSEERAAGAHADAYESSGITDAVETVKENIVAEHGA